MGPLCLQEQPAPAPVHFLSVHFSQQNACSSLTPPDTLRVGVSFATGVRGSQKVAQEASHQLDLCPLLGRRGPWSSLRLLRTVVYMPQGWGLARRRTNKETPKVNPAPPEAWLGRPGAEGKASALHSTGNHRGGHLFSLKAFAK